MHFSKFSIFALLAGTSLALPNPQLNVRDEINVPNVANIEARAPDVAHIEARSIPHNFYQHAVQAIKAHGPGVTKTMMHSHIGPAKAFQVSKKKKLQIVETTIVKALNADKKNEYKDTLKKYCVKKEDYCEGDDKKEKDWIEAWAAISKAWAEYAKTETTLATDKHGPDAKSFYKTVEEKILNHNKVKINVDDKN